MATLKITSYDGSTVSVDFASMDARLTFTINNPFIIIEPPNPTTASDTAYENFNAICINLSMFAPKVSIEFTETSGLGSNPFALSTRTSVFSKLIYLSQIDKSKKRLYINSNSNYVYCQISNYRAQNAAGKLDIITHNLDVTLLGSVSQ